MNKKKRQSMECLYTKIVLMAMQHLSVADTEIMTMRDDILKLHITTGQSVNHTCP